VTTPHDLDLTAAPGRGKQKDAMPRSSNWYDSDHFPPYVPVAQRAREAAAVVAKLKKKGHTIEPVSIAGRAIATTFWGKAWCSHLESLSDFQNRLPRGRTYVRRGAVIHLALESGRILAKVQGTSLYDIVIGVVKLQPKRWSNVVAECTGSIDSLVELLRGKLSESVMRTVTNGRTGLFPAVSEITMSCSCPDWAGLCKHLAAVLYGVGARLDARPELLFTLRGVDPSELVAERAASAISEANADGKRSRRVLASSALSDVFGIELERAPAEPAARATARPARAKPAAVRPSLEPKRPSQDEARGSREHAQAQGRAPVPRRRDASDFAETSALVLAFIESHPGLGVERIGQSLGLSTKQLSLRIKKLTAMGSVVGRGMKRATKYFVSPRPVRPPRSR
jgi:uncharacterized Zn finger protein